MSQRTNKRAIVLAAAAVVSAASWAQAGTITWDGGADGSGTNWNDPLNWAGDVLPTSADTVAFSNNKATGLATTKTISLGAPQAVDQISIPDWSNVPSFTIGSAADVSSGNTLTLARVYRGDSMSNTQTIAANVVLSQNSVWTVYKGYNGGLAVSGSISGDGKGVEVVVPNGGSLTFSGANTYTGPTTLNSGTLSLSFASNSTNILSSSSALVMGGGGLTLSGKASTVNSQTVNGLTLNPGASSLTIANSATANPTSLTLGAITRNVGGTVNFVQPPNGSLGATNGFISSAANDAGGILGGYATVGASNWATNNGTNIVALSTYTDDSWAAGNNTNVTVDAAVGSPITVATTHSLRFNAAGARTLNLSGTSVVTSGGVMVTSVVGANPTTIAGGTLTSGGSDLIVHQFNTNNAGAMTISSAITDNGASPVGLTKAGGGILNATGTLSYTGGTYVNGGQLSFGSTAVSTTTVKDSTSVTVCRCDRTVCWPVGYGHEHPGEYPYHRYQWQHRYAVEQGQRSWNGQPCLLRERDGQAQHLWRHSGLIWRHAGPRPYQFGADHVRSGTSPGRQPCIAARSPNPARITTCRRVTSQRFWLAALAW